jgi:hypothetical protein
MAGGGLLGFDGGEPRGRVGSGPLDRNAACLVGKARAGSSDLTGRTVSVTLRPSGGGAGFGLAPFVQAMQALGLDLAALPTVTVISDA